MDGGSYIDIIATAKRILAYEGSSYLDPNEDPKVLRVSWSELRAMAKHIIDSERP